MRCTKGLVALWWLAAACKGDAEQLHSQPPDESTTDSSRDSETHSEPALDELGYDLLFSVTDAQTVMRLRLGPDARETDLASTTVWTFRHADHWDESALKPHGLNLIDDTIYVGALDYFTEGVAYTLDVKTGALVEELYTPTGAAFAGEPSRVNTRATHNIIPWGDELISSDTHNNRVLAVSRDWEPRWEISTETLTDAYMRRVFSNPNDVELIERDGVEHLMVSTRGENFNHVLLFAPAPPQRPGDPLGTSCFGTPSRTTTPCSTRTTTLRPSPTARGSTSRTRRTTASSSSLGRAW
jgi:hypothetical protein